MRSGYAKSPVLQLGTGLVRLHSAAAVNKQPRKRSRAPAAFGKWMESIEQPNAVHVAVGQESQTAAPAAVDMLP